MLLTDASLNLSTIIQPKAISVLGFDLTSKGIKHRWFSQVGLRDETQHQIKRSQPNLRQLAWVCGMPAAGDHLNSRLEAAPTLAFEVAIIFRISTSNINQITEKGSLAIKYRPAPFCFQSGESIISLILQIELIADTYKKD